MSIKRGDKFKDEYGEIKVMAVADNYAMCRRPRCIPFAVHIGVLMGYEKVYKTKETP